MIERAVQRFMRQYELRFGQRQFTKKMRVVVNDPRIGRDATTARSRQDRQMRDERTKKWALHH